MGTNQEEKKALAKEAKDKLATYGTDINLEAFSPETGEHPYQENLSTFPLSDQEQMLKAGVDIAAKNRSGTFVQKDLSVVHCSVSQEGMEIMDIDQAREKYDWLNDYWWKAMPVNMDKYTARAELRREQSGTGCPQYRHCRGGI
jgi:hypothetical protein